MAIRTLMTEPEAVLSRAGLCRNTPTKERPILFSGPMVRALLAGAKTQTRREMSAQPHDGAEVVCEDFYPTVIVKTGEEAPGPDVFGAWWSDGEEAIRCPYGKPGDRLWVREAWSPLTKGYAYRADPIWIAPPADRWRSSIFMPRAASRITLEITHIRAERLHDISEADALSEGVEIDPRLSGVACDWLPLTAREAYERLWKQINGPDSWVANRWVWVVAFQRC